MVQVKLLNSDHGAFIRHILETNLETGSFCDVTFHFRGTDEVLKCHKSVLAAASPLLRNLFRERGQDEESHITLTEQTFEDTVAVLNLVYKGEMMVTESQIPATSKIIEILHLKVNSNKTKENNREVLTPKLYQNSREEESDNNDAAKIRRRRKRKKHFDPKANVKRPLFMKIPSDTTTNSAAQQQQQQQMMLFVMPPPTVPVTTTTPVQLQKQHQEQQEQGDKFKNSYQRAKCLDKEKFRCTICGRGFPLACLLRRHNIIHMDKKPFQCQFCTKEFTTKVSTQHHEFTKHLGEKSKLIQQRKQLQQQQRLLKLEQAAEGQKARTIHFTLTDDNSEPEAIDVLVDDNSSTNEATTTVLETEQGDIETVIEVVETTAMSTANFDGTGATYTISDSGDSHLLYNVGYQESSPSSPKLSLANSSATTMSMPKETSSDTYWTVT